jgi:hypothetical protein
MAARRFVLERQTDVSGVSGIGTVVEGVLFSDGAVVVHWLGRWPTSTVFHSLEGAMEAVDAIHGHDGATLTKWVD